jgi:hypothetical protein
VRNAVSEGNEDARVVVPNVAAAATASPAIATRCEEQSRDENPGKPTGLFPFERTEDTCHVWTFPRAAMGATV